MFLILNAIYALEGTLKDLNIVMLLQSISVILLLILSFHCALAINICHTVANIVISLCFGNRYLSYFANIIILLCLCNQYRSYN